MSPVLLFVLLAAVSVIGGKVVSELRSARGELRQLQAEKYIAFDLATDARIDSLLALPRYADPLRLARHQAKIYSQHGEDGEIAEIFRRIGTVNNYFVEFGSSDGNENNTVNLLNSGWSGLWIDGDEKAIAAARSHFAPKLQSGALKAVAGFITAENIESYFAAAKVPPQFDLMSVDIDRNDWYVWRAIVHYRPRVVVIEYNSIFPPAVDWVVPYDPKAWWDGTSHFGASLKAMERLGREKGYSLVGCDLSGVNAYFVQSDLVPGRFAAPFTAENHYEPARYYLAFRAAGHRRKPY